MTVREIYTSTKTLAKTATGILELSLNSISAIIYMKKCAWKAKAAFRRTLTQQGLPDTTVGELTSAYGEQLKMLSSISHWAKQFRH